MKTLWILVILLFTFGFSFIVMNEETIAANVEDTNKVGYACYSFVDEFTNLWIDENVDSFDENLNTLIKDTNKQITKLNDVYMADDNEIAKTQMDLLTEANEMLIEIQNNPNNEELKYANRLAIEDLIEANAIYSQDVQKSNEGCQ